MPSSRSRWTNTSGIPISVLDHAESLKLEKFTSEELDAIAGCSDIFRLELVGSKAQAPIDLGRLAHLRSLRLLGLTKVKYTNLAALKALPHLRHLSIDNGSFADVDDLQGFAALQSLTVRNSKLAAFPAGLDLPRLEDLDLSGNRITDVGFAASYPGLDRLDLDGNPVQSLAPLAGRQFNRLGVNAALQDEKAALALERPEPIWQPDPEQQEIARIVRWIAAKDWAQVHAVPDSPVLRRAFAYAIDDRADEAMVRGILAHPHAFHAAVAGCLDSRYTQVRSMVEAVFADHGDQLVQPLTERFHSALAMQYYDSDFQRGKLKHEHAAITGALLQLASPAFTDLFLAFFGQRDHFSQTHLFLYKQLLDVVGKTGSPRLVEPLIDLLRLETQIIGGDAAFMKKVFKAIGVLGTKADAVVLASRFDVAAEARPDVGQAYEAALARLEKKKA